VGCSPPGKPLGLVRCVLTAIRHLLDMYRRQLSDPKIRRRLERWTNRLAKIASEVNELDSAKE